MIWIILIIALIVRLVSLNQSLWLDEAINVVYASSEPFWYFVTVYPLGDFHPPGFFAMLWGWIRLFGNSEISVRTPSVLFGVASVYLTFLIGRDLFNKRIGLVAAGLLAVAPLHIYYSQEARMYSFAAFAVTLSFYCLIGLLNQRQWAKFLYPLSIALVFYSDYVAILALTVQWLWVWKFARERLKLFGLMFGVGVILAAPGLLIFPQQLLSGQATAAVVTGWRSVVGGADLKDVVLLPVKIEVGRVSFENNILYAGLIMAVSMLYLFILKSIWRKLERKVWLVIGWLILPPILSLVISLKVPIFAYFRFIFILPAIYLLLAVGLSHYKGRVSRLLLISLISFEILFSGLYLFNPKFQREDWRGAAAFIQSVDPTRAIVVFENSEVPAPFIYYQPDKIPAVPGLSQIPVNHQSQLTSLSSVLTDRSQIYLFEYLVDVTDPERLLPQALVQKGYSKVRTYNFNGLGFIDLYETR